MKCLQCVLIAELLDDCEARLEESEHKRRVLERALELAADSTKRVLWLRLAFQGSRNIVKAARALAEAEIERRS